MSTRSLGSHRSLGSGMSYNASINASDRMERDLLERMVCERDEKITGLQKTVSIQKEHTTKLQHTLNDARLKMKVDQTKRKIQMDSIMYERDLAQSLLNGLAQEREKYRDTKFTLDNNNSSTDDVEEGRGTKSHSPRSTTQFEMFNNTNNSQQPTTTRPHTPARTESAHALYLQSQLYQAMHSISALQLQTKALKSNCDTVVRSLEEDLLETTSLKHQVEVELMSQLTLIEREKGVMEGLLQEKIRIRDGKLKRYEAKIRGLEGLEEESDSDDDENEEVELELELDDDSWCGRGTSNMSLTTVEEPEDGSEESGEESEEPRLQTPQRHESIDSALTELELLSERISKHKIV